MECMLTSLSRRDPAAHAKDFEQLDAEQAQMIQLLYIFRRTTPLRMASEQQVYSYIAR